MTTLSKQFLRFFQNFSAFNPEDNVSFLQVEALMCPSLFFWQLADGSFPGAIPYFLYKVKYFYDKFNFEGFYDHLLARMTYLEMAVSGNIKYTFMLIDGLFNITLNHTVTRQFFNRGIQNIDIKGIPLQKEMKIPGKTF